MGQGPFGSLPPSAVPLPTVAGQVGPGSLVGALWQRAVLGCSVQLVCLLNELQRQAFLPKGIILYFKVIFNEIELCCVLCFLIENALLGCFCNVLFTANAT